MRHTILVVDDDALVRRSVDRVLRRAGYQVLTATDVQEAVHHLARIPVHAALVDYALAHEDGLQVLARLRELQPSCLRILMTGRTDFPMVVEAVNRGEVLRVVRKPFQGDALLSMLSDAFDSARRAARVATSERQALELAERMMLEEVLQGDLLRLALQPIVEAKAPHRVVAYEALLRSKHPVLDGPLPVLRVAEQCERVHDLGRVVFQLAARWLERLDPSVALFVNLHPQQLGDAGRLQADIEVLADHADRVSLEITEHSRLHDLLGWEAAVEGVTRAGFSLAVDDLGAGYNSLRMLADLSPRFIKVDMSLVRNIDRDQSKQRLVHLLGNFAEASGARLIAEGVETAAEAEALIACGSHLLQGYLYGRPSFEVPDALQESVVVGAAGENGQPAVDLLGEHHPGEIVVEHQGGEAEGSPRALPHPQIVPVRTADGEDQLPRAGDPDLS